MRIYLLVIVLAAAVTFVSTPLVRVLARRVNAVTPLRDRDVHAVPTPRMGGIAMFAGFAVALLIASAPTSSATRSRCRARPGRSSRRPG